MILFIFGANLGNEVMGMAAQEIVRDYFFRVDSTPEQAERLKQKLMQCGFVCAVEIFQRGPRFGKPRLPWIEFQFSDGVPYERLPELRQLVKRFGEENPDVDLAVTYGRYTDPTSDEENIFQIERDRRKADIEKLWSDPGVRARGRFTM